MHITDSKPYYSEVKKLGDINAPEFLKAMNLSDFDIFVKEAESIFVETNVLLNEKGHLFIDFKSFEQMYSLCTAITKRMMFQNWTVDNDELSLYTNSKENKAILSPYRILPKLREVLFLR